MHLRLTDGLAKVLVTVGLLTLAVGAAPVAGQALSADWAAGLKADYGFAPRHLTRADLGLKPDEVWQVKFSTIWEGEAEAKHPYDEYMLKLAMQGLINRSGPLFWNDTVGYGWAQYVKQWQAYFGETRKITFRQQGPEIAPLVRQFARLFNGIILYDFKPSDKLFLAMNLANLNFCLPVSRRLYDENRAEWGDLPVVADLTGRACTRAQVYDWMIANVLPLTNRTLAHNACIDFDDLRTSNHGPFFLQGLDYPFYRKAFIFNLSAAEAPLGRPENPGTVISGSPEIASAFDRIMAGLIEPAAICGWGDPEDHFIARMTSFGHYMINITNSPNLSFVAATPPLAPPPYLQDTRPKIAKPAAKLYIAFLSNEGDTAICLWNRFFGAWDQPSRGTVPINWGINPANVESFPALFEYFHKTKTANDYFVLAASGAGYVTPRNSRHFGPFLAHTRRSLAFVNCRELDVWGPSRDALEQYIEQIPELRGVSVVPEVMPDNAPNVFTIGAGRQIPMIRHRTDTMYWFKGRFIKMDEKGWDGIHVQTEDFLKYLGDLYQKGPGATGKPAFLTVYGVLGVIPNEIARIQKLLDPAKYEVVDYGTLFHLAAQTNPPQIVPIAAPKAALQWTPALLRQPQAWLPLNNATLSAAAGGLRIGLAEGKDWGVVRVSDCQLPPGTTGARVRVREISPGASWAFKMAGDFYRLGTVTDLEPFAQGAGTGERSVRFDPDVCARLRQPLHNFQIGVVGPPGSFVVFDELEFTR